jgi:hypothetical protein
MSHRLRVVLMLGLPLAKRWLSLISLRLTEVDGRVLGMALDLCANGSQ